MPKNIWNMRFLSGIDLPAKRQRLQNDEYNIPRVQEFQFTVEDADVQPIKGNSLLALPEGLRNNIEYQVYTKTPLDTAEEGTDKKADKILIYGAWYVVVMVVPWRDGLDDNYLAYVRRETLR